MSPRIGCLVLALSATIISLFVSKTIAWQLGEAFNEKALFAAFGVLTVMGAHWLLPLCRSFSTMIRFVSFVLWVACMMYVICSHASFFLLSQQQAGMRRSVAVDQATSIAAPQRTLAAIFSEQIKIKTELAAKSQIQCLENCFTLKVKLVNLQATLNALDAEADDVKRWHAQQDRQDLLKESMQEDPVTVRVATWSGLTLAQVELVRGLLFSVILEGVACLCWYLAFQSDEARVTQPKPQLVEFVTEMEVEKNNDANLNSDFDPLVEKLVEEVRAGKLKLSVDAVRKYCNCAQAKASKLTQLVRRKLITDAQAP
ncbi:MAG: hypothetical protein K2Y28_02445 [Burkholderiaceae bacterium]|nr:hypothetical protein [Burkholderiaceae bacterium]